MPRVHLVELEDLPRFPTVIRDAGTAYLRLAAEVTQQASSIGPVIERALERSGESRIVDLCSGGGGPAVSIASELASGGRKVDLTLTDLYPSDSLRKLVAQREESHRGAVRLDVGSVDATAVAADRVGLRTFFNAFHHFRPDAALTILRGAVEARQPIAVVEILQRGALSTLSMLGAPLAVLLAVPFLRPFRAAWLPLTYLLPIIPFFVMWDGLVSSLRVYSEPELRELIARADPEGTFDWEISEIPLPPLPVAGLSLVGIPKERLAS